MIIEESTPSPLFRFLDDDYALPVSALSLSRREAIRQAYEQMRPQERPDLQRELCARIGDPSLTFGERTRLIDITPLIRPDRATRRLIRRQIVDDVRDLFLTPGVPTPAVAIGYVRRLRCLQELGAIESSRFWMLAYQLCGSASGLSVFTAIHARQPDVALDWLTTYLSPWEQVRVLEKALPEMGERGPIDAVVDAKGTLDAAKITCSNAHPRTREWREVLLQLVKGVLNSEVNRAGIMEYLRDTVSQEILPEIEGQESHLRIAVERLFEDWATRRLALDQVATMRLLALTRDFHSQRILAALVMFLESIERAAIGLETLEPSLEACGGAILDSFAWFDALIGSLARSSNEDERDVSSGILERLLDSLETLRTIPGLTDRANRELVRHSRIMSSKLRSLVLLMARKEESTDWLEELDRRMPGEFEGLACAALQAYRLQGHLKERLSVLAKWCDETYTLRDRLLPGSGWAVDVHASSVLRTIAEARESEELESLVDVVTVGAWQASV